MAYRGRFAPSPTGPLHLGSLAAAVASYLQAQSQHGEWLVRIEDIDPPREVAGSSTEILRALDAHGFDYPSPVYQHDRYEAYSAALEALLTAGHAYRCSCTRQIIEATARQGRSGLIYPGTCRGAQRDPARSGAIRVCTTGRALTFIDGLQGAQRCDLETEIGDFVIRRGDGLFAYQLAVVVDDHWQGITEVVRGMDLLDATFMQCHLQALLGYESPHYAHIPLLTDTAGRKLSKQTNAQAIDCNFPVKNIFQVLVFLNQCPEPSLLQGRLDDVWQWAIAHWNPGALAGQQKPAPTGV